MLELVVVIIIIAWCLKTLCVVSSSHFRSLCCVFFCQSDMLCYVEESWRNVSHGSEVANGRMKHFFPFSFCLCLPILCYVCWLTCTAYFFITWRHFWHNLLSVPFFFGLLGSFLLFLKGSFFSRVIHFALSPNWLDIQSGTLFFLPLPFSQSIATSCVLCLKGRKL